MGRAVVTIILNGAFVQSDEHRALEAGMRAVLDLDPFAAAPGAIAAIASLGDDPLKPHDTYLSEDDRAVRIRDVLRQAQAVLATIQKLGQQRASRVPGLRAQIAAVQLQHIEGVQEHIGRALPAKHGAHEVEIGDTVRSADHTLAVEDHRADRQRSQGGGDRRELRAPLVTGA